MRAALVALVALAACDLQPPKKQPARPSLGSADAGVVVAPVVDAMPVVVDATKAIVDARPGRPPADALIDVTDDCVEVGVAFTEVYVATASDLAERSAADRDRTRMVRKMAEMCTTQSWTAAKRKCWLEATTRADHKRCTAM